MLHPQVENEQKEHHMMCHKIIVRIFPTSDHGQTSLTWADSIRKVKIRLTSVTYKATTELSRGDGKGSCCGPMLSSSTPTSAPSLSAFILNTCFIFNVSYIHSLNFTAFTTRSSYVFCSY